ncbi:hypothetical protein SAMN04488102_10718 [Alkalibacterium subtropicum]|uniref:Uncharacterized protein n=1 Tax=Alkalibacterium subtropicum TaxID=753702 RepID=A0A1I1J838_9LACT|nr:hypothetical protein [Alkalibacterium subtropicum]SFC44545.1 hypothetical protein SAMN04488102_10718 [Alkalibacterium subtropicum]
MKKFYAYLGFTFLSFAALIMIGFLVVAFLSARLDVSKERLDKREQERSALEDHWIASHKHKLEESFLRIADITLEEDTGTIEWEGSDDASGTVHFNIDSEGTIVYLDNISEFPKYPSYPKYFRDAIHTEMN